MLDKTPSQCSSTLTCICNILTMLSVWQHYSYVQSGEIRAKVDELLNCEDIFLNALVADLIMRPAVHAYLTRLTMFPLCER